MIKVLDQKPASATELKPRLAELTESISASRLNAWQQCRLKFWFRYVEQIPKPKPIALYLGSAVHAALEEWNRWRWQGKVTDMNRLRAFMEGVWEDQLRELDAIPPDAPDQIQTGWGLVEKYISDLTIPFDEKPEAVEVLAESDLSKHGLPTLRGDIDLVRPGGRIVDFKTTARSPNAELSAQIYQTQTSIYAILYRENTGKKESGIELHHLIKTRKPNVAIVSLEPIRQQQVDRLYRTIDSYVDGLLREDIIPSPGFHCASCEYFRECQQWS